MLQVADDLFNTLDPDIYNKILALDGVKDNFFMAYELHFGFGSLETYLVGYSDFKLCTRNALTDAGLIGIYNMHDQIGLWDAMNALYPWDELADKMIQHNPDAFLLAGLGYLPQYATQMLESGMAIEIEPYVWQPLYKISLEQFFDSIRTYPGLGEAYMLQLTKQLIALGYASPGWSYAVGEHHIYGSTRLGIHQTKKELRNRYKQEEIFIPSNTVNTTALYRGKRNYELSNHLGNVNVVISDKRKSVCDEELDIAYFESEVLSGVDYYSFGMMMPDRQWYSNSDTNSALYGFNGMRKDNEINGVGNALDFGARIYDSRIARFNSVDVYASKNKSLTPYSMVDNSPLVFVDPTGNDLVIYYKVVENGKTTLKSFNFNGTNYTDAPKDVFVQAVLEAYIYDTHNGGGDNLRKAANDPKYQLPIFELDEESSPNNQTSRNTAIPETLQKATGYKIKYGTRVILFNTRLGVLNEDNTLLSPATVLEHEADHYVHSVDHPEEHDRLKGQAVPLFGDAEEKRATLGSMSTTAIANGETYKPLTKPGIHVMTVGVTATTIDFKATIAHYEKLEKLEPHYEMDAKVDRVTNYCKTGNCDGGCGD